METQVRYEGYEALVENTTAYRNDLEKEGEIDKAMAEYESLRENEDFSEPGANGRRGTGSCTGTLTGISGSSSRLSQTHTGRQCWKSTVC